MPDEVLNKIKFLCKSIPKDEWSGILFYSVEGSIVSPETFKITLEDILPMDKGTPTFTSYDVDERYMEYIMEDESRMDWQMGHIHSHNTMNVYFSHTDKEELQDNSPSHNYYLSLIVNNFMEFTAKVAFIAGVENTTEEIPYYALNENGEKYVIEKKSFELKNKKLYTYDCNIISKAEQILVETGFESKVNEIMKPKVVKTTTKTLVPVKQNSNIPVVGKARTVGNNNGKVGKFLNDVAKNTHPNITEDHTEVEIFALTLLNFTNMLDPKDDIDSLLDAIEELEVTDKALGDTIIDTFATLFEHFFPFHDEDGNKFLEVLDGVIEYYEEHENMYPILSETIDRLKQLKVKFEDYDTTFTA